MTTLFDTAAFQKHQYSVVEECRLLALQARPFKSGDWKRDEPDLYADEPYELIDVKLLRDQSKNVAISARQFDKFAEYDNLTWAIWKQREKQRERVAFTSEQLLERAISYQGGGLVRPGRDGRGPYYLFDVSTDTFVNPFASFRVLRGPDRPREELQISFAQYDGMARAVAIRPGPPLGPQQKMILEELSNGPMKAWHMGVFIHRARGHCNDAPSRRNRDVDRLRPGECCHGAVDDGGPMATSLSDRGMIFKDEYHFWHLYPEDTASWSS